MHLQGFKEHFDRMSHSRLSDKIKHTSHILRDHNFYVEYVQNVFSSGGKRVRPFNVFIMYIAYQKNDLDPIDPQTLEDVFSFVLAFELLHTMAIVHDDRMDCADTRRSVPCMHEVFAKRLDNAHVGASQAILIGDLLFARAYESLMAPLSIIDEERHAYARQQFTTMVEQVILGQVLDVDMTLGRKTTKDHIVDKSYYKTASYTFVRPFLAGAALAGLRSDDPEWSRIREYGESLGLAYQYRDDFKDMADVHDDKSVFNDVAEGQQTLMTQYVYDNASAQDVQYLRAQMGTKLSEAEKQKLHEMFEKVGVFDYMKKTVNQHLDSADQSLKEMKIDDSIKQSLWELSMMLRL